MRGVRDAAVLFLAKLSVIPHARRWGGNRELLAGVLAGVEGGAQVHPGGGSGDLFALRDVRNLLVRRKVVRDIHS